MVDKTRLLFRGGLRTFTKTYEDATVETFHYKARTPNELAAHFGAENALKDDAEGGVARQRLRAKLIATSLCTESGEPLLTASEAELIPGSLKAEICNLIAIGSNDVGDAGTG